MQAPRVKLALSLTSPAAISNASSEMSKVSISLSISNMALTPFVVLNYQFHFISVFRSLKATRLLIYHILLHARSLPRPRCSFTAGANLFWFQSSDY